MLAHPEHSVATMSTYLEHLVAVVATFIKKTGCLPHRYKMLKMMFHPFSTALRVLTEDLLNNSSHIVSDAAHSLDLGVDALRRVGAVNKVSPARHTNSLAETTPSASSLQPVVCSRPTNIKIIN